MEYCDMEEYYVIVILLWWQAAALLHCRKQWLARLCMRSKAATILSTRKSPPPLRMLRHVSISLIRERSHSHQLHAGTSSTLGLIPLAARELKCHCNGLGTPNLPTYRRRPQDEAVGFPLLLHAHSSCSLSRQPTSQSAESCSPSWGYTSFR